MAGPLSGVRVLDCSRLMPFAYGTQLLVEAGADVVKVEAPGGEYGRGMAGAFTLTNRGKRSVTLDLRTPAGREVFLRLASTADAVLESFRPGFLGGLSLGYDDVRAVQPSIVYCSGTGYGQSGPYASRPGHDANYAAVGGLLAPDGGPVVVPPVPYVDMVTGWAAAYAITIGVFEARTTGHGRHFDVGMADVALSLNTLAAAYEGPAAPTSDGPLDGYPWPDLMREGVPCYGVFTTRDGSRIALANVEPRFWAAFLAAIDRRDLAGERFVTGERARAVRAEIAAVVAARTLAEWDAAFRGRDVCWSPVNDIGAALSDPHLSARGAAVRVDGGWHIRSPIAGGRTEKVGEPPEPGAHTEELLAELGYDEALVRRWRTEGVL